MIQKSAQVITPDDSEKESDSQKPEEVAMSDGEQASYWLQLAGGLSLLRTEKKLDLQYAFRTLNDPEFANNILKISDPQEFQKQLRQYEIAKKEIEKQRKRKKDGKTSEYAQVGIGNGRFGQRISFEDFDRRTKAIEIAGRMHSTINTQDRRLKLQETVSLYGLSEENASKLVKNLRGWMKANPGRSYDDYFLIYGRRLYLEQQVPITENPTRRQRLERETKIRQLGKKQRKDLETKEANLRRQFQGARYEATRDIELRKNAREEIRKALNLPVEAVTPASYQTGKTTAVQPSPSSIDTLSLQTTKPVARSEVPVFSSIREKTSSVRVRISLPRIRIPKGIKDAFSRLSGMFSAVGAIQDRIKNAVKNLAVKALTKIATKLGGTLLKQALVKGLGGVLTGGTLTAISTALDAIKAVTGIDIEKIALKTAMIAVAVPICLILLTSFLLLSKTSKLFPIGNQTPQKAMYKPPNSTAWRYFEKKYLSLDHNETLTPFFTWGDFEKTRLSLQKKYTSLEE